MTLTLNNLPAPTDWVEWCLNPAENMPPRLVGNGIAAQFVGQLLIAPMNVFMAAAECAVLGAQQNDDQSPDDVLPVLGVADALPQYANESNVNYRLRLQQKWNVWAAAGQPVGLIDQLVDAGFPTATIAYDLTGGGDYVDAAGNPIFFVPSYLPSAMWWSQFLLNIPLTVPLGNGAILGPGGATSQLINAQQLATIQLIVKKFKPAKWRCAEVMITLPGTGTIYDDGFLYDDNLNYDTTDTWVIERFPSS
jgi:hypothetical protein